jgi:hypothetical protein
MKIMLTDMNLKLKFQKQVPVMRESSAAGSGNSKIERLWKSDPWAALHKIVGTFYFL